MAGSEDQFIIPDRAPTPAYYERRHPNRQQQARSYWCFRCNMYVVPADIGAGQRQAAMICPECCHEISQHAGTPGATTSPSLPGLRYRRRHRFGSESDLSRLEERMDGPSTGNRAMVLTTFTPEINWRSRQDRWAISNDEWDGFTTRNNRYSNDDESRILLLPTDDDSDFAARLWRSRSLTRRRNTEPTWQQFMQEMLQSFLRRGEPFRSIQRPDYTSDPGDYLDDDHGFERLLSELAEDSSHQGPPPASKSAIATLPSVYIKQKHLDDDSATCPVCKELMELNEVAKELPCQHLYHEDCILPWLTVRNTCPVCRYELPTDDADYEAYKRAMANRAYNGTHGSNRTNNTEILSVDDESDSSLELHPNLVVNEEDSDYNHSSQERRGWFWYATRPLLSIVGFVLALTIGNRLLSSPRRHLRNN